MIESIPGSMFHKDQLIAKSVTANIMIINKIILKMYGKLALLSLAQELLSIVSFVLLLLFVKRIVSRLNLCGHVTRISCVLKLISVAMEQT